MQKGLQTLKFLPLNQVLFLFFPTMRSLFKTHPCLVSFQASDIPYPFSAVLRFNNMTDHIYWTSEWRCCACAGWMNQHASFNIRHVRSFRLKGSEGKM